jgi:hypothetical protein
MDRRKETRTVTRAVETRIEFSAADLRKRLRLPADAELVGTNDATGEDEHGKGRFLLAGLSAMFVRKTTKGG